MTLHPRLGVSLLLLGSLMGACSSGSGTSTGSSTSGGSASCIPISDTAGEPDILSAPSFSANTVAAGSTIHLQIPIDADTSYIAVNLFSADRSNFAGGGDLTVATPGVQTVTIDITTGLTTTPDNYFPMINVCTDFNSCIANPGSTGIAVSYTTDSLSSPGPNYTRTKFYDNGDVTDYSVVCMTVPYVTIQ